MINKTQEKILSNILNPSLLWEEKEFIAKNQACIPFNDKFRKVIVEQPFWQRCSDYHCLSDQFGKEPLGDPLGESSPYPDFPQIG